MTPFDIVLWALAVAVTLVILGIGVAVAILFIRTSLGAKVQKAAK